MALAILEFLSVEKDQVRFRIDTGTNKYYYFKIGSAIETINGMKLVGSVATKTPLERNGKSDTLLNTGKEVSVPASLFTKENCYVQLFSFKTDGGRSPALSKIIKVPVAINFQNDKADVYSLSTWVNNYNMTNTSLNRPRNIPHNLPSRFSTQNSFDDILAGIIKIAAPIVMGMISGFGNTNQSVGKNESSPLKGGLPPIGMFNTIVDALLNGLKTAPVATSAAKSLSLYPNTNNRFLSNGKKGYSKPFNAGIEDTLLASVLAGLTRMMPQPGSTQNQYSQQENKFMTALLSEDNRNLLLKQFLENQGQADSDKAGAEIDISKLLQLLQQLPAPAQPVTANTPAPPVTSNTPAKLNTPVAGTQPLAGQKSISAIFTTLSTSAVLSFEARPVTVFNGKPQIVFTKSANTVFKVKLNVIDPVPKSALPKAITRFCFKDRRNKLLFEKIFKQKEVMANSVLSFDFTAAELNSLPANVPLQAYAEMKWLSSKNTEIKALGSAEIFFADTYFLKEQGKQIFEERELTDMTIYRSFWNKIWESPLPVNPDPNNDEVKKYRWELEANLKYTVLISGRQDSNGLMETKMLTAEKDAESLTEKTEGRFKAGIELSISELNKLAVLWDKKTPLVPDQLAALKMRQVAFKNSGEFIYNLKLKGKAAERGMVWLVPVLKLSEFILNKIKAADESGQVIEVEEETVLLPLPVSVRIIGLKSK